LVYDKPLFQAIEEYPEMKDVYHSIHKDVEDFISMLVSS
jgi:hypothetical protein